jgi:hypothetical protein
MQAWYMANVLPKMKDVSAASIRREIGAGVTGSIDIRFGRTIPHPRCYRALAALTGVEYPW